MANNPKGTSLGATAEHSSSATEKANMLMRNKVNGMGNFPQENCQASLFLKSKPGVRFISKASPARQLCTEHRATVSKQGWAMDGSIIPEEDMVWVVGDFRHPHDL